MCGTFESNYTDMRAVCGCSLASFAQHQTGSWVVANSGLLLASLAVAESAQRELAESERCRFP